MNAVFGAQIVHAVNSAHGAKVIDRRSSVNSLEPSIQADAEFPLAARKDAGG